MTDIILAVSAAVSVFSLGFYFGFTHGWNSGWNERGAIIRARLLDALATADEVERERIQARLRALAEVGL